MTAVVCADCGYVECSDTCPSLTARLAREVEEQEQGEYACRCDAETLRMDPRSLPRLAGCCARTVYSN